MCARFSFRTADTLESRPRKKRRAGSPLLVPPLGAGSALKRVVVAKVSVLPNWQPSAILTETALSAFADFVCNDNTLRQKLSILAWKGCRKCDGRPAGVRFNLQNLIGIDYPTLAAGIGNGKKHARSGDGAARSTLACNLISVSIVGIVAGFAVHAMKRARTCSTASKCSTIRNASMSENWMLSPVQFEKQQKI